MKQITFTPRHHQLTNTNTWTPDSQWLVFDVRPSGASFTGKTIERVNVHTGDVEVIYRAVQGAHVGVVTVHPADNHYVFIHGPENPDETWHYDVPVQHPREYSGSHWCVLVSRTTPAPRPGSDDINRAYEEGWVTARLPLLAIRVADEKSRSCLLSI